MKIIVTQAFKLTRDDGSVVDYPVGEHDMPEADAKHWYTALFSGVSKFADEVKAEAKAVAEKVAGK